MLKIILNRLKPQPEKIIAEKQAGFRAGRSTIEQIFNPRILLEKYLQHQQDLYHVFIDFKKAFNRVWHAALWAALSESSKTSMTRPLDPYSRTPKKNTSHGDEVLSQDTTHLIQRPCYLQGSPRQDSAGSQTTSRPPDHHKETQTAVVWSCLPFIRSG